MIGSNFSGFAHAKGLPARLAQRARKATRKALDRKESDTVRRRSVGICEVVLDGSRCTTRAVPVHHLLRGVGKRAVADSLLTDFKVHVCSDHHWDLDHYWITVSWTTANPQRSLRFQRVHG